MGASTNQKPTAPVVVGIDGSASALRAAEWAVDEAISRDAALRLIHVIEPGSEAVRLETEYAEIQHHHREDRSMTSNLSSHHRVTIDSIFTHPAGANVEWHRVLSLLESVGTVTEQHNGKLTVTLGPETEVFEPPRGKDVSQQLMVDLRRMLTHAGFAPSGDAPLADTRKRDHGDGQWGAPD
ncbi:universal stress protein [Mycolicibacterium sp.]|uniref:universal stress protein n=1 Tax=Mycolicibacterium sp. TaxID=2320850 RepID=UPI001A1CAF0B|nr:universal stress protein [Mycolicibacterium sp.]MBJ7336111.1 universal stress protein [Mycolicibacterium sp.]